MARVLIVGINYWPEASGIAPYTTALAEHLAARHHEVTVITGMPHYPAWRTLPNFRGALRRTESRNGVTIARRAHYVPARQSAARRGLYEATFLLSGLPFALGARPDAVVGIVPSLSGGMLAKFAAARARAPYALVFQDLMGPAAAQSGISGGAGLVARLTSATEAWVARSARSVAVVSPAFVGYLAAAGVPEARIEVVPNWTRIESPAGDREETRARLGWVSDDVVALHSGNMGLKQGLEQLVEVARLARIRAPRLRLVFAGDGSQRAALQEAGRGLPNLTFLPFQPEAEFPDVLAAADLLLLSERPTVTDMSLPSKVTSYLVSGRPIVAAVARDGASAALVEASGGGVVVGAGDPAAILTGIEELLAQPAEAGRMGTAGKAYAERTLSAGPALSGLERLVIAMLESSSRGPKERG